MHYVKFLSWKKKEFQKIEMFKLIVLLVTVNNRNCLYKFKITGNSESSDKKWLCASLQKLVHCHNCCFSFLCQLRLIKLWRILWKIYYFWDLAILNDIVLYALNTSDFPCFNDPGSPFPITITFKLLNSTSGTHSNIISRDSMYFLTFHQ